MAKMTLAVTAYIDKDNTRITEWGLPNHFYDSARKCPKWLNILYFHDHVTALSKT